MLYVLAHCSNSEVTSTPWQLLQQINNITVSIGEDLSLTVGNNSAYFQSQRLSWQHNGYVLKNTRASFDNGTLVIMETVSSDAGHYSFLFFDSYRCESTYFKVFVECKTLIIVFPT